MRHEPYSYRSDPAVPPFDDSAPIVIFDGMCVLCSADILWMLKRDPSGTTRFSVIQDPIAQALYRHYGLDAVRFDTFMVLAEGLPFVRWAGVVAALETMPAPWRWLGALGRFLPDGIGNAIYDWVQRNRLSWFGKREACFAPDESQRSRFLAGSHSG